MSVWTAFWSERAGRAEQDSDRLAALVEHIVRRHNLPEREYWEAYDVLRDYRGNREARYRALPAGPTAIGNLSSGGIHV